MIALLEEEVLEGPVPVATPLATAGMAQSEEIHQVSVAEAHTSPPAHR
jgi:hypothetical protein